MPTQMRVDDVGPGRPVELVAGDAQQVDVVALVLPAGGNALGDVVDHAEHSDHRGRVNGHIRGLVVKRHIAAGDRDLELQASVGKACDGLAELPHYFGVLGGAEVEAVADGDRGRAGDGDVAVRLGEGEAGALAGVELAPAAIRIRRHGETKAALLIDAHHSAVIRKAERGVAADVPVVLVGDPVFRRQVGAAEQGKKLAAQLDAVNRPRQRGCRSRLQRVDPGGVADWPLVDRSVDGDGARVDVDNLFTVPIDDKPTGVGDFAEHGGFDVPLLHYREKSVELFRVHDGHHPLLALAHQNLFCGEAWVAQQHPVELDEHAAVAVGGELARRAADAGCAQVLDALDQLMLEQFEAALDEHLLGEGVADLHGRALGRNGRLSRVCRLARFEAVGGEDGCPADAVSAGARTE